MRWLLLILDSSVSNVWDQSIRLKNQFRSLDEDEAEFLESVLESTRAKEDEIRKETSEQLGQFRSQQEEAERLALETEFQAINDDDKGEWLTSGKKRRKIRDKALLQGSKSRKISSPDSSIKIDPQPASAKAKLSTLKPDILTAKDEVAKPKASTYSEGKPTGNKLTTSKPKTDLAHSTSSLGLATYSSSDDDEKDDD